MTQALLIAVFIAVIAQKTHPALAHSAVVDQLGAPGVCAIVVASMAAVALAAHIAVWLCARRLDRRGDARMAWRAERIVAASRIIATLLHVGAVFGLGWLVAIRAVVGDLVLVDELLAVIPVLAVFVATWASLYPIDRRIREAVIIRALDEGAPIEPYVSLPGHIMSFVRHQLALIAAPIILILGWSEFVGVLTPRVLPETALVAAPPFIQLGGAIVIFIITPWLMRHIWRTHMLDDGELRARLTDLCRAHKVRVRELLVWNTHGVLVNGAVMGLIGQLRYVLLSDGLLTGLSRSEVEAVAAHEVGHIRRRHIPWLAASVVVVLILTGFGADALARALGVAVTQTWELALFLGLPLIVAGVLFGWISRRFEWQADAFAAQHLSGWRTGSADVFVTPDAADAMVDALGAVARLNHIPVTARSWRHGSIASRQARLRALVGMRADRLPIDRTAARIKLLVGAGALAAAAVITLDLTGLPAGTP